jgi:hypothetical protein
MIVKVIFRRYNSVHEREGESSLHPYHFGQAQIP